MIKDIFDIVINKEKPKVVKNNNKTLNKPIYDYLSSLTVKKLGILCAYYKESKTGNKDNLITKF